jgi:hypothetical protein
MKRNSLLILSALALLIASCSKKGGKSGLMVPKDAAIVVHVNSASLSSKLSWAEISETNWFEEMSKEATDSLAQQLLKDPASSGVDTKADLVFYMKKQGQGSYLVFEGSLTDAAAFEKMLKEIKKEDGGAEVKKDGDFSYMTSENEGLVLWNKSNFAYINNAPLPDMKVAFEGSSRNEGHEFLQDSLRIFGKEALTLKGSDNLDTDSRFAELVKNGSDVHLWANYGQYYQGMAVPFMNTDILFKGNISTASLNFDNGKIAVNSKQYYGDEMSKFLADYKAAPISADVINRIPSNNVVGVLAFNYPPKGLQQFLKTLGVDGMANGFLSKLNYSIDEFVKANKGEVILAVSDYTMATKQDTIVYGNGEKPYIYTSTKPDMKVLFATSVNDKASFEKLITLAWESTKGMTEGMPAISYKLENNWFAASNSAEQTDKFLAGGNNKLPFVDKIAGHPIGMYLDLQKIIQTTAPTMGEDSSTKVAVDVSLKMWQDVVGSGGEYKDKSIEFTFDINLVDKSTNSLKQLNQYADKLAALKGAERKRYEADGQTDAPAVEAAPKEK